MEDKILEGSHRDKEPWLEGRTGHSPPLRVGSIMAVFISHDAHRGFMTRIQETLFTGEYLHHRRVW
jgi:hypothetical protein